MAAFSLGYKGKTRQFAETGACHRTTIAHFLNKGKWNSAKLEELLKKAVINIIYSEAARTGMPIYCFVDDTISSKTKPSSKALHPIQDAYYHQSHLKKKQDYGHQAVAVMLSCNGITLNYAIVMYDKTKSKIQIVQEIARELPVCPVRSYFLCDSWYTCAKIVAAFREKGFHTMSAIKTNRLVSFDGDKLQLGQLADAMQRRPCDRRQTAVLCLFLHGKNRSHRRSDCPALLSPGGCWESIRFAGVCLYGYFSFR